MKYAQILRKKVASPNIIDGIKNYIKNYINVK